MNLFDLGRSWLPARGNELCCVFVLVWSTHVSFCYRDPFQGWPRREVWRSFKYLNKSFHYEMRTFIDMILNANAGAEF